MLTIYLSISLLPRPLGKAKEPVLHDVFIVYLLTYLLTYLYLQHMHTWINEHHLDLFPLSMAPNCDNTKALCTPQLICA